MQKLLAHWWVRIIIAIIASILLSLPLLIFPSGFLFTNILTAIGLTVISISLLAFRAGSAFNAFGLQFDKFAIIDFLKGFIIVISMNLIFIILGLISGYEFRLSNDFSLLDYKSFLFISSYIFLMAYLEEIIFRGIVFQTLRERFGDFIAILLLSIFFSLAHYSNPNISNMGLINIILAGIMLSVLYITTESLWLPISVHFFWNLNQQVLLGSNISGINFDIKIFELTAIGNEYSWFFGGQFGIEEGALTTILLTILTVISFRINRQNPYIMATKFRIKFEESKLLKS
ncbi:MAG: CPBP family intramembrane glutamic endopeptidase [Candidatus Kapaibacterium sp.]|nr:CPBP family intramembrane metalloprotease [Ignavibacteriota bacterium]MCB9220842.1 CPBP family intramembrane metalloprotease [Ignavibacteria bacterium]